MPSLRDQLASREVGTGRISASVILQQRCAQLRLSRRRAFQSAHAGGITWLALDGAEQRYLLAGAADATIAVYDTHALDASSHDGPHPQGQGITTQGGVSCLEPVCAVGRQHPGAHQYLVSTVAWYPADTGLFVSGSYDQQLKLWDTNTLEVVSSWTLPAKVSGAALSSLRGAADGLVAVACQDVSLRLCDLRTGGFTHTLVGHRHPIWCVSWSARDEYQLASGDAHGQVCLWDIRRFGPTQLLDMYCTQRARPQTADTEDMQDDPGAEADPVSHTELEADGADNSSLDTTLESAWRTLDQHRSARAGHASSFTSGQAFRGKRARELGDLPTTRRGPHDDMWGGRATAAWQAAPHGATRSSGAGSQQGGAGLTRRPSPFHHLPLSSSAPVYPGHNAGRIIGGRVPQAGGRQGSSVGANGGLSDVAVRAHQGSVTCVLPTPDGLFWLSGGTDSRLRLWDAVGWHRQLAGYTGTHNRAMRARQLAVTQDGGVTFHPSGSTVQVFDVRSAALLSELSGGHTESINACVWSPLLGELYTGANDCRILVWTPRPAGRSVRDTVAGLLGDDPDMSEGDEDGEGRAQQGPGQGQGRGAGGGSSSAARPAPTAPAAGKGGGAGKSGTGMYPGKAK